MSSFINRIPPVVVVVYTRNDKHTIAKTLQSIQEQAYPVTRLVIIIDKSFDETSAIVKEFALHAKIPSVLINNQEVLGRSKCINRALTWIVGETNKAKNGEGSLLWNNTDTDMLDSATIALLCGGDVMLKNRLLAPMMVVSKNKSTHFVYGGFQNMRTESLKNHSVSGWTFRLSWLCSLASASIFDIKDNEQDHWGTFVQMLSCGPALNIPKNLYTRATES